MIREIGERALNWIDREFPLFDPFDRTPERVPDEASQTALGELALVALVLKRHPRLKNDPRLDRLLDYIEQAYSRPVFHNFLFDGHPLALTGHLILWLASVLRRHAFPVSLPKIQELIDVRPITVVRRSWYRWIELRYFLDLGGLKHNLPSCEDFFLCSPFAEGCEIADLDEEDLYGLTHMVMYLSDFGRVRPLFFSEKVVKRLRDIIDQAIEKTILDHQWDLLAELLLSRQCLLDEESSIWRQGWEGLGRAIDKSGAIPEGPDRGIVKISPDRELTRGGFLALYHRTLMTALAAFVQPNRDRQC